MNRFADLSFEEIAALQYAQREEFTERIAADPFKYFPWHDQQTWFLQAAGSIITTGGSVRIMNLIGGNRGGKSVTAKGLMGEVVRRRSPLNLQLTCTDQITGATRAKGPTDSLRIWVVPPTSEKGRSDWAEPADGMGIKYWLGDLFEDERKHPDHIFYSKLGDQIWLKSQDQAKETFESSEVDICFVDEEMPDEAKINSILMRLATVNGILVNTFTPLNGLSWSYRRWWRPHIEEGRAKKLGDRRWIYSPAVGATVITVQVGMRDNPKAASYADEVEADPEMTGAEKAARLSGKYGFVEGALLPALSGLDLLAPLEEHKPYVVDHLPGQRFKDKKTGEHLKVRGEVDRWYLIADPNKSFGALLGCMDQDGNLFFVASHLEESWPDRKHAAAFKSLEKKYCTGKHVYRFADPGSAGAHAIVNLASYGVYFTAIEKPSGSVSTSIKRLRGMTAIDPDHIHPLTGVKGAPRVYFYRPGLVKKWIEAGIQMSGSPLCDQLSMARQSSKETDPPDTPHKTIRNRLDLWDCARYMALKATSAPSREARPSDYRDPNRLPPQIPLENDPDIADRPFYAHTYGV